MQIYSHTNKIKHEALTNVNSELSQLIHTMHWPVNYFHLIRSVQNYSNAKNIRKLRKRKNCKLQYHLRHHHMQWF